MESYDMYGTSPWGKVPDVLEMYGMCSYRNWYEYLEFVDPLSLNHTNDGRCSTLNNSEYTCGADTFSADKSKWWDTTAPNGQENMPTIWDTQKFRVHAHECDRDYMHLLNHQGCAPVIRYDNSAMGMFEKRNGDQDWISRRADRSKNIQTLKRQSNKAGTKSSVFIDIISHDSVDFTDENAYRKFGFLSLSDMEEGFVMCRDVEQCFVDIFTYNGKQTERFYALGGVIAEYKPVEMHKCGIFGIRATDSKCFDTTDVNYSSDEEDCCMLDRAVVPLYETLCGNHPEHFTSVQKACSFAEAKIVNICASIGSLDIADGLTYYTVSKGSNTGQDTPRNIELQTMATNLNSLMDAMVQPPIVTSQDYLKVMGCSSALYEAIQTITSCPTATTISPYCTPYHQTSSMDDGTILARSGIYLNPNP
jgi:hypothetical protein